MITIISVINGDLSSFCYPDDVLGRKKASEKFNLLVEDLQIKDEVENPISGAKLTTFANSFGCVTFVSTTPIRPWLVIKKPLFKRTKKCKCKN